MSALCSLSGTTAHQTNKRKKLQQPVQKGANMNEPIEQKVCTGCCSTALNKTTITDSTSATGHGALLRKHEVQRDVTEGFENKRDRSEKQAVSRPPKAIVLVFCLFLFLRYVHLWSSCLCGTQHRAFLTV